MAPSSRIQSVLQSVRELSEPIHVIGASGSSRALVLARLLRENKKSLLVLCPNDDAAADLASDIETWSVLLPELNTEVCHFPNWEQSPYSPIAPSIRVRLARLGALSGLTSSESPPIIITTLAAACQVTLSPDAFEQYSISLELEESVESREILIRKLLDAGYLRTDPAEDPGTFAVRGDIIDVFPPDLDRPIRIELFGDLIERMREFDPATQRTESEGPGAALKFVKIVPAREVLINHGTLDRVRAQVKERADDVGIPRATRDPIISLLHEGTYPDHSELWAPFAYESTSTLWEYLSPDRTVVWDDELSCRQEWDQYREDQKRLSDEAIESGLILPAPKILYRDHEPKGLLFLDRIEMAKIESLPSGPQSDDLADMATGSSKEDDLPKPKHRLFVKTNADLAGGSRHSLGDLEAKFQLWLKQGFQILALASTQSQLERIRYLLEQREFTCKLGGPPQEKIISLFIGSMSEGIRWPAEGLVLLTESDILGTRHVRRQRRLKTASSGSAAKDWSDLQALSDLSVGDAVVHLDHGIGRYQGLSRLNLQGAPSDFLLIEYANRDKLYLPIYRLNVIQKYAGSGDSVTLDKLGSQQFAKTKEKVKSEVKKLAFDLVQLYAERKIRPGIQFSGRDSAFREFEAKFPFDETPDQLKAIDASLADMESGRAMDRLVCGDVGYGKTEVAIRAAFRAVSDGKQVAVLVPTTVLAHQHEQSFKARMAEYPINVESVSRFKSAKEQKAVLESLAKGKVDIVIGTHRLLSKDVKFQDLGLLIIDEEHRFGVEHKEKIKTFRVNTHVLTLTATPIPRTLHMALSGLRDISLINTAPIDRLPIRTYVSKFDEQLIQKAIEFELNRGGQVFFLHNRVQTIHETAAKIKELVPNSAVSVGHGQMSEGALEQAMLSFYQKQTNVLVCTTIIESGLDIPSANTIIVDRADSFGLAQLYQIRGRVGRGQQRAYAYLLLPAEGAISEDAKKRLEVIQKFVELGSGFSIASHDLEIRGGGDLLGAQQSGHIAAVGFELYTELLEEAIRELQGKPLPPEQSRREPEIKTPFAAFLPENFVPDVHQRLSLYRRLSASATEGDLNLLEIELKDRFGELPTEAQNLIWLIRIKQMLKTLGIDALVVGPEKVSLQPGASSQLNPARAISLVSSQPSRYNLTPDSKFVAKLNTQSLRDLHFGLEELFKKLQG